MEMWTICFPTNPPDYALTAHPNHAPSNPTNPPDHDPTAPPDHALTAPPDLGRFQTQLLRTWGGHGEEL